MGDNVYEKINELANSITDLSNRLTNHNLTPSPGNHECSFKTAWIETTSHAVKLNGPLADVLDNFFIIDEKNDLMHLKKEFDNRLGREALLCTLITRLVQTQNQMMVWITKTNKGLKEEHEAHSLEKDELQKSLLEITRTFNKLLTYVSLMPQDLDQ